MHVSSSSWSFGYASLTGPSPARFAGLGFGAEPAFALALGDPRLFVPAPARRMVDPVAARADIPLDEAAGYRSFDVRANGSALTASPVPRHHEPAGPDAGSRCLCRPLGADVVIGIAPVGDGPSLSHHPTVEVFPGLNANGDDASVSIDVHPSAGRVRSTNPVSEGERCLLPAPPRLIISIEAQLGAFRRIYAV